MSARMNNHLITFTVSVDVDRNCALYRDKAVAAIDPFQGGSTRPDGTDRTAQMIDKDISLDIAFEAVRSLVKTEGLGIARYGKTTISVVSPKNLTEVASQEHEDDSGS